MAKLNTAAPWGALLAAILCPLLGCQGDVRIVNDVPVAPSLEDRNADGTLFTPGTQTLLRGHHWLEGVEDLTIEVDPDLRARLALNNPAGGHSFSVDQLPMELMVPRLHYRPQPTPDAFDRFNLMMAEFSRNGVSVPTGKPGDTLPHFESDLREEAPWTLSGDYAFVPNPAFRPLRFGVTNNCLAAGLWELSGADRTGELYHSWFTFPAALYTDLVSEINGLPTEFARDALQWRTDPAPLDLDRLRAVVSPPQPVEVVLHAGDGVGFSSQDSRRKLSRGYVQVRDPSGLRKPNALGELTQLPVSMTAFIEPGRYSKTERNRYDLSFLAAVKGGTVSRVTPLTSYDMRTRGQPREGDYVELTLDLGSRRIVVGNLPLALLVPQEDFVLNGFGVGIFNPSEPAERRQILLKEGPAPSFAYVVETIEGAQLAVNSHDLGVEQIFIRTHLPPNAPPWWEVVVTSYERIADLVKYRVEVPADLAEPLRREAARYVSPLYSTYRDDNIN